MSQSIAAYGSRLRPPEEAHPNFDCMKLPTFPKLKGQLLVTDAQQNHNFIPYVSPSNQKKKKIAI